MQVIFCSKNAKNHSLWDGGRFIGQLSPRNRSRGSAFNIFSGYKQKNESEFVPQL